MCVLCVSQGLSTRDIASLQFTAPWAAISAVRSKAANVCTDLQCEKSQDCRSSSQGIPTGWLIFKEFPTCDTHRIHGTGIFIYMNG